MKTLLEIIDHSFNKPLNQQLLKELKRLGYIDDIQVVKDHELLRKFFTYKVEKKPEKRDGIINHDKCLARIWGNGECRNIQCSFNKTNDIFCDKHNQKFNQFGFWYLGKITEKAPEIPLHPGNGRDVNDPKYIAPHETKWLCDSNGVKIENNTLNIIKQKKEEKKLKNKKKRGRPPGSKNKKKVVKKETEDQQFMDDYVIDGVEYDLLDNQIWDINRTGKHIANIVDNEVVWINEQIHKNNLESIK